MGGYSYRVNWLKYRRYRYIVGGHGERVGALARALEVGRRVGYAVAAGIHHRQRLEAVARVGHDGERDVLAR